MAGENFSSKTKSELLDLLAGMPEFEWRLVVELFQRSDPQWLLGAIAATQVRRDHSGAQVPQ